MISIFTFIICFFKFVSAQEQQVFSGTLQVYNWGDASQKIIIGNNSYSTMYDTSFSSVPTLCIVSTQGYSFEYHDYLAFIISQVACNQTAINYFLQINQNQVWSILVSFFIYNDVYNQFRSINPSNYQVSPIDNSLQTGSGDRYMIKNISFLAGVQFGTNQTFTSNNLQIWPLILGFQVTAISKILINVKASFNFAQQKITLNISVNYDTMLTILWIRPIIYSTIWSSKSSKLSHLTRGTVLMNEGMIKDLGIYDYNTSFLHSFNGLNGLYIDLSTFSLGTVLFKLTSSIYYYESDGMQYLSFEMHKNDSVSTTSSPKLNFFYLIIYNPIYKNDLTSETSNSIIIYAIVGVILGVGTLLGGSVLFYKYYLKKRLIRKKFQLSSVQNIRFQM